MAAVAKYQRRNIQLRQGARIIKRHDSEPVQLPPIETRDPNLKSWSAHLITRKTYWYAWKGRGAPRLVGEPGTPEFVASYNAAVAAKIVAPDGRLLRLLQEYQRSQVFLGLGKRKRTTLFRSRRSRSNSARCRSRR
jgi:hypothetical protein